MIVSSFYNALIDEEEAIPTSTMLEIERIRENGIIFVICTNRLYEEVLDYNKDFPFIDYIISLNGGYVYDVKKGRCLSKNKISKSKVLKISEIFKNYNILYYTENNVFQHLEEIKDQDIYKIEIEKENIETEKLKKLNINTSSFMYHQKKYLEITSNKSSMFSGVDQISIKTEISLDNIMAIGANESDYSLIKNVKKNYIVRNCHESLKKIASNFINSNTEKGVEQILKKMR